MNEYILEVGQNNISKEDICDKRILDIGSRNVNGSLRDYITSLCPVEYIGIDIEQGDGVDLVCDINDTLDLYGSQSFDFIVCAEMLEHCSDIEHAVNTIKELLKIDGQAFISVRGLYKTGYPFKYHGYPNDYWRFTKEDINNLFDDCEILLLEDDKKEAGVIFKIKKIKPEIKIITSEINSLYRMDSFVKRKNERKEFVLDSRLLHLRAAYTGHLGLMFYGLVRQLDAQVTVECGIGGGYVSGWLTYAMYLDNGIHYAIDIDSEKTSKFGRIIKQCNYQRASKIITSDSKDVKWDRTVDFVFLDSDHTYEQVKGEILKFEPFISSKGAIAVHDYCCNDEVKKACDKYILKRDYDKCVIKDNKAKNYDGFGTLLCIKK